MLRMPGNTIATTALLLAACALLLGMPPSAEAQGLGSDPPPVTPKFADGFRTNRDLPENAEVGYAIGAPVTATHENSLAITYSLTGTDAVHFSVDSATGQLSLKEGMNLTVGDTFMVNLFATDSAGKSGYIIVDIEVVEAVYDPYDANQNGAIERDEVIAAVQDYFAGRITRDQVIALVQQYFAG